MAEEREVEVYLSREDFRRRMGLAASPYSVGVVARDAAGNMTHYIFTDGAEMDDLERLGRLEDPR